MNRRGNKRRRGRHVAVKPNKATRCTLLNKVVWEHEVCPKYETKTTGDIEKNCKNCKHSF